MNRFPRLAVTLIVGLSTGILPAQEVTRMLSTPYRKNGEEVRSAFGFVAKAARQSVVRLSVDGKAVALGTVVDGEIGRAHV